MKRMLGMLALAVSLAGMGGFAAGQTVSAVPTVDLNRFSGTWYEIARLPNKREKKCIADVVDVLALGDKSNQVQIVSSCKMNKGYMQVRNASAKALRGSGDAKLKVTYLWPFHETRWVLAVDGNYEWALVGSPNHKMLWVVSKTPSLSKDVLAGIEQKAAAQGFAADKLTMTLQTGG